MNQIELKQILETTGHPVAYRSFKTHTSPPFIVYLFAGSDDLIADNHNYHEISQFQIELYTIKKDLEAESKLEAILKSNRLPYNKNETYIDSEEIYQIVYQVSLI